MLLLAAAAAAAAATLMFAFALPGVEDLDTESTAADEEDKRNAIGLGAVSKSYSRAPAPPTVPATPPDEAPALLCATFEVGFPIIPPVADVSSDELDEPPRQSEELPEEPLSLPGPP